MRRRSSPSVIKASGGAGDDNIQVILNNLAYVINGGDGNDRIDVSNGFVGRGESCSAAPGTTS